MITRLAIIIATDIITRMKNGLYRIAELSQIYETKRNYIERLSLCMPHKAACVKIVDERSLHLDYRTTDYRKQISQIDSFHSAKTAFNEIPSICKGRIRVVGT
jgi:hypothetical protein